MWPDWVIYWTLGNFSKLLASINLSKSRTFYAIFVKVSKSLIFAVVCCWKQIIWLSFGIKMFIFSLTLLINFLEICQRKWHVRKCLQNLPICFERLPKQLHWHSQFFWEHVVNSEVRDNCGNLTKDSSNVRSLNCKELLWPLNYSAILPLLASMLLVK